MNTVIIDNYRLTYSYKSTMYDRTNHIWQNGIHSLQFSRNWSPIKILYIKIL